MRKDREFSDGEKAQIFARDRATCAFSGASLWIADQPIFPNVQADWVDHVKPMARGGKSSIENGVAASHTMNAKKGHNSSDRAFLFFHGHPTEIYFSLFGELGSGLKNQLKRYKKVVPSDWYFNRAIQNFFWALNWRCLAEFYDIIHKRTDEYWFKAGRNKAALFLKKSRELPSLEERCLLDANGMRWHAAIEACTDDAEFSEAIEPIHEEFRLHYEAWKGCFWDENPTDISGQCRDERIAACIRMHFRNMGNDDSL